MIERSGRWREPEASDGKISFSPVLQINNFPNVNCNDMPECWYCWRMRTVEKRREGRPERKGRIGKTSIRFFRVRPFGVFATLKIATAAAEGNSFTFHFVLFLQQFPLRFPYSIWKNKLAKFRYEFTAIMAIILLQKKINKRKCGHHATLPVLTRNSQCLF